MSAVSEAVILMAGSGSRVRGTDETILKPLLPVAGRPLICYTIDTLAKTRIGLIHAVVGFQSASLTAGIKPLIPAGMQFRFIHNPDWQKQNGISVLAAAKHVSKPFLLTMSDHLFDQAVVDLLLGQAKLDRLNLAIDQKLDSIFDLDDAMKVRLQGDRVVTIGKDLNDYNAIDTGLFVCPAEIFTYLEHAKKDGDVSLADGVRAMARDGKVRGIDIGDAWWQDVDTPEMLRHAEATMRTVKKRRQVRPSTI